MFDWIYKNSMGYENFKVNWKNYFWIICFHLYQILPGFTFTSTKYSGTSYVCVILVKYKKYGYLETPIPLGYIKFLFTPE